MSVIDFLRDAQRKVSRLPSNKKDLGLTPVFNSEVQELDGFRVGFMLPLLFDSLCKKYGLDPDSSEAILMQADCHTTPHVHAVGKSVFLPLGIQDGFTEGGGTYMGPYTPGNSRFDLAFEPATPGTPFSIDPGVIHFFTPGSGSRLSALAFVSPRIRKDDGNFDITHFSQATISSDSSTATIEVV